MLLLACPPTARLLCTTGTLLYGRGRGRVPIALRPAPDLVPASIQRRQNLRTETPSSLPADVELSASGCRVPGCSPDDLSARQISRAVRRAVARIQPSTLLLALTTAWPRTAERGREQRIVSCAIRPAASHRDGRRPSGSPSTFPAGPRRAHTPGPSSDPSPLAPARRIESAIAPDPSHGEPPGPGPLETQASWCNLQIGTIAHPRPPALVRLSFASTLQASSPHLLDLRHPLPPPSLSFFSTFL